MQQLRADLRAGLSLGDVQVLLHVPGADGRRSATRSRTAGWWWSREAAVVRRIFDRFAKTGSALTVARALNAAGEVTKRRQCASGPRGGKPWTKGAVYKVLANRVYVGEAMHKGSHIPASTPRSSTSAYGTRRTLSWPSRRTDAAPRPAHRFRRC
jgi:hypothetical protein